MKFRNIGIINKLFCFIDYVKKTEYFIQVKVVGWYWVIVSLDRCASSNIIVMAMW